MARISTVDECLRQFSVENRKRLDKIRMIIKSELPNNVTEKISYGIPTYHQNRNFIHFGGYGEHIDIYPGSKVISELKVKLKSYTTSKGTIQFPLDKPLDEELIRQITRLAHNLNQK